MGQDWMRVSGSFLCNAVSPRKHHHKSAHADFAYIQTCKMRTLICACKLTLPHKQLVNTWKLHNLHKIKYLTLLKLYCGDLDWCVGYFWSIWIMVIINICITLSGTLVGETTTWHPMNTSYLLILSFQSKSYLRDHPHPFSWGSLLLTQLSSTFQLLARIVVRNTRHPILISPIQIKHKSYCQPKCIMIFSAENKIWHLFPQMRDKSQNFISKL